jgi:hypothetical protein
VWNGRGGCELFFWIYSATAAPDLKEAGQMGSTSLLIDAREGVSGYER